MNPTLILLLVPNSVKRLVIVLILTTALLILAPVAYLLSYGTGTLSYLANSGSNGITSTLSTEVTGFYNGSAIPGDSYDWGNCTYWSYALRLKDGSPISNHWGNANTWDDRAKQDGYRVDHLPEVGAVYQNDHESGYGHVAYVSSVSIDGSFTLSEMNYKGYNIVDSRTLSASSANGVFFIHEKATL